MSDLFIEIKYDLTLNHFEIKTNVKPDKVQEIIETFLRFQIGKGEDKSEPNKINTYTFKVDVDLSFDNINITSDAGNDSLRDGILMNLLNQLMYDIDMISWEES